MQPPRKKGVIDLGQLKEENDTAQRICDAVNLHFAAHSDKMAPVGKWVACSIRDGRSDGELYPTRNAAISFQKGDEREYLYIRVQPGGMLAREALSFLRTVRAIYKSGSHLVDPRN